MAILYATPQAASEGAGYIDFIVRLDVASLSEVRVNYRTEVATATYSNNLDFVYQTGTLIFAPGELSKTVRVLITNDTTVEGTEAFWLSLTSPVNASVAQQYTAGFIHDNDGNTGTPLMAVSSPVVDETAGTATFWVSLSKPSASPVSASYSTASGTAVPGLDFTAAAGSLSFAPGEMVKTVTVNLLDDSLTEFDETFQLVLANPSGATLGAAGTATIGRSDGAPAAAPYVSVQPIAVSEGSTRASFVVQLSAPSTSEARVDYRTEVGSATYSNSLDFQYITDSLVFKPGETTKTVTVLMSDDSAAEAAEVFWLNLTGAQNAVVQDRYTPALIIDNDGTSGTPGLSVSNVVVDESGQTARFFVTLNRSSVVPVTVDYATQADTAASGNDFRATTGSLFFAPGEMVKTVVVDLVDDNDAETDEFFQLVLANPGSATLADAVGVAMIGRNDTSAESTPQVLAAPIVVGENETFATWTVQLSAPSTQEVRVNYRSEVGSATYSNALDFTYVASTLVFAPGETSKTVPVLMSDGTTAEPNEIFWLDLMSAQNAVVPQRYVPALVIDNDGASGTPAISVRDMVVDEVAQTAAFFVTLNRPSTTTVSVDYGTADGTAVAGQDFGAAQGRLSFAPGEVAKTVVVNLYDDNTPEPDEFFDLRLANPSNATLGQAAGTATIGRNDTAPVSTPYITATPVAVGEGEVSARFTVQLSAPAQTAVSLSYRTEVGTATYSNGLDFDYQAASLIFAPGETTKTVEVLLGDGTLAEGVETFWLDLSGAVGGVIPQRYTPALVFDNDGSSGVPSVSVTDTVVNESAQTARFFVSLSRPSVGTVTVPFSTGNDTAQAGADYAPRAGTLSFAPGEMVKTVIVDLVADGLAETDERFNLLLGAPTGATLADAVGTAVIGAGDTRAASIPQILSSPIVVSEGDIWASFVVRLSAPSTSEVRVNYQTDAGTATYSNAQDFTYQTGTLVFAPGDTTQVVRVLLGNDLVAESTEGFTLDLNSPVNATVPQRYTTATISDNDNPGAVFSYGLGNDLYTVGSALDKIVESPGGGIDTVRSSISITLPENVENLVLTGGALNALGNAGNNIFRGTAANNVFDGKEGIDTVIFSGPGADYALAGDLTARTVTSAADGSDTLYSVERLQFVDYILASDTTLSGNAYKAFAMFNAGFDVFPTIPELSMWTAALDRLGSTAALAQAMINYYAPGVSDEALVTHLWGTIVETPIPLDALSTYVGLVANGTYTQASLVEFVAEYELNALELVGIVGQTLILDPAYFPAPG